MKISLVSPVYNEEASIEAFVRRSVAALNEIEEDFELILINDCSTDATSSILDGLKQEIPRLSVIHFSRNRGQHAATITGLMQAMGDYVFLIDSDLQVAPENMVNLWKSGKAHGSWDVISGARKNRSDSILRTIGSKLMTHIINSIGRTRLSDPGTSFLMFNRRAVSVICRHDILAQNLQILIGVLGFTILEVPIDYQPSKARKSNYKTSDLVEVQTSEFNL